MKCDSEIRNDLFSNIILSGGSTMFPGFVERIQKEITAISPSSIKCEIVAAKNREYAAWMGGSMISSLCCFKYFWISKRKYEEYGPNIIHRDRKC